MSCPKLIVSGVILLSSSQVLAFNVDVQPSLSIEESFTDNVRLADSNKDDEIITSIKPNIRILQTGSKINSELNYLLENNNFINEKEVDFINNLDADSNVEIIDDFLFTYFQVKNSQQNITNTGIVGTENTSLTDNTDNIFTYRVNPSINTHYSNLVNLDFSYDFNSVDSERNESDSEAFNIELGSGSYFSRLGWNTSYLDRTVEAGNSESLFKRLNGGVQYFISRTYSLNFNLGYEDNDFPGLASDNSGMSWNVGATWRPNPRTELDFSIGERFFGANYQASIRYTHKRIVLVAEYSETVTLTRDNLLNQQVFNVNDLLGNPLDSPDISNTTSLDVNAINQNNNVFIARSFEFGARLNHRRYELRFDANFSERDFLNTSTETNYGASIGLNYSLNSLTELSNTIRFDSQDNIRSIQRERYRLDINLSRTLTQSTNVNFFIRHTTSDSDIIINNYKENRLGITLNRSF